MPDSHTDTFRTGRRAGIRYAMCVPRRAPSGLVGAHLANRPGSSLEFMDHRSYQPGDDLRHIDWAAYARSDRLTVKVYRHEVNPHVDLLVDGSRSMDLEGTAKGEAVRALAALLATAARNASFSHRVWLGGDTWQMLANGSGDPVTWGPLPFDAASDTSQTYLVSPPRLAPRGLRFLVSDLLWMGEPERVLAHLAEAATTVVVIQVLADADVNGPPHGHARLVDSETGGQREVFIDTPTLRRYRGRLARHQQHWHRAAKQAGAVMTTLVAETFLAGWDLEPLVAAGVLKVNPL